MTISQIRATIKPSDRIPTIAFNEITGQMVRLGNPDEELIPAFPEGAESKVALLFDEEGIAAAWNRMGIGKAHARLVRHIAHGK